MLGMGGMLIIVGSLYNQEGKSSQSVVVTRVVPVAAPLGAEASFCRLLRAWQVTFSGRVENRHNTRICTIRLSSP